MKSQVVTLSIKVKFEYETEAGLQYLLHRLASDVGIEMGGGGDVGPYSMKSVDGTATIKHGEFE